MFDRRVLVFGDSFTAGVGDPTALGWVGRVAAAAFAAGEGMTFQPLGIRRDTTADVAARFGTELRARHVPGIDTRVVLATGANDCVIEDGVPRLPAARSTALLGELLRTCAAAGLPAFVVGPAPVGDPEADAEVAGLDRAFAGVCKDAGVPYVPVARALQADGEWLNEAAAGDGAHPGAGGYAALARVVLAGGLLDWLTTARSAGADVLR